MIRPKKETHTLQEEQKTIPSANDKAEEEIFNILKERKVGNIYYYQSISDRKIEKEPRKDGKAPVMVDKVPAKVRITQVVVHKGKVRIEITRDLIDGRNPFRIDPNDLI